MRRNIKVDFYEVKVPEELSTSFERVLEASQNIPRLNRRVEAFQKPLLLYEIEKDGNLWLGQIFFVRTTDLPEIIDDNNEIQSIDPGKNLGEQTTFLYDPQRNTFLVSRSSLGPSLKSISSYFKILLNHAKYIEFAPKINPNKLFSLDDLTVIYEFELHAAGLDMLTEEQYREMGADQVTSLYNQFLSPTVFIQMTMGQRSESHINVQDIISTAKRWLKLTTDAEKNRKPGKKLGSRANVLRLTGATKDEEEIIIDLIKDRLQETVSLDRPSRSLSFDDIAGAVKIAWNRYVSMLLTDE